MRDQLEVAIENIQGELEMLRNRQASGAGSRELSIAATKLQEACMWIGEQIRAEQVKRDI